MRGGDGETRRGGDTKSCPSRPRRVPHSPRRFRWEVALWE